MAVETTLTPRPSPSMCSAGSFSEVPWQAQIIRNGGAGAWLSRLRMGTEARRIHERSKTDSNQYDDSMLSI